MILIICICEGVIDLGFICMDGGVSHLDHDWHIFFLVYAHHLLTRLFTIFTVPAIRIFILDSCLR